MTATQVHMLYDLMNAPFSWSRDRGQAWRWQGGDRIRMCDLFMKHSLEGTDEREGVDGRHDAAKLPGGGRHPT